MSKLFFLLFAIFLSSSSFSETFNVVRLHIEHVDLRGEQEGSPPQHRRFFIYPILCQNRFSVEYYKGAADFMTANHLEGFQDPSSQVRNAKSPQCVNAFISDQKADIYGIRYPYRGRDNVFDWDFLQFSFDPDRTQALFVWADVPIIKPLFKDLTNGFPVVGYEWVSLSSHEESNLKIISISNPLQNISLKLQWPTRDLTFLEKEKTHIRSWWP